MLQRPSRIEACEGIEGGGSGPEASTGRFEVGRCRQA